MTIVVLNRIEKNYIIRSHRKQLRINVSLFIYEYCFIASESMDYDEDEEDNSRSLYSFLQGREVDVELKEQKIDGKVISEVDERELSYFIPNNGDRVRSFLRKTNSPNTNQLQRKSSLKQTLKAKRYRKRKIGISDSDSEDLCYSYSGNKNAVKDTRQEVELVIKKKDKTGQFTKICPQKGGGPRKLPITKSAKKDEIIKLGKQIYFGKDGNSKLGSVADFQFEMQNYKGDIMDDTLSVGDLYNTTGLTLLTFYLLLTPIKEEIPKISAPNKYVKEDEHQEKELADENVLTTSIETHSARTDLLAEAMIAAGFQRCYVNCHHEIIPYLIQDAVYLGLENTDVQGDAYMPVDEPVSLNEALTQHQDRPMGLDDFRVLLHSPMMIENKKIRVHRSDLFNDMITIFKQQNIIEIRLMFEYVNEEGSDLDGVSRDVYSSFWIEFLMCSSEGEDCRVPALNSRCQAEEWKSIGRILAKGFKDHQMFPLQLAKVAAIVIAFGEETVTTADLFDSFLHFVSKADRDLIQVALKEDLNGEDKDNLLNFLERFGCSINPSKDNMKSIINKIAHKELIQKPKYAMDNMALTCREVFMGIFVSVDKLLELYVNLKPTPRKFLKLLKASPITNAENASFRYFQQYIKGQNTASLRRLLRFMTGSETITVPKIDICFTKLEGFNRRPIAHTCGPSLELPSTYSTYPELRMELDSILSDDSCLVMNIA